MRILATLIAAVLGLSACSSTDTGGTTATPPAAAGVAATPAAPTSTAAEPRTEAAVRAAAGEEFDAYASGDYGAAWDEWTTAAKKLISRADYMHLFELCPQPASGVRFTIDKVTMNSDGTARVRATRLIAVLSYQFAYEAGHWRFVPDAESMRDYRTKTVQQMAQEHRAQGACGK